jgi:hypothetical protein
MMLDLMACCRCVKFCFLVFAAYVQYKKYRFIAWNIIVFLVNATVCIVPGGKVSILGHSISHSKQECVYVRVSYFEQFPLLIRKRYYVLFLIIMYIVLVTKLVDFK